MSDVRRHPRHELNALFHSPVRLSMVAILASGGECDFQFLREAVEASDSLLSKNLSVLEAAGYVKITKSFQGKRSTTWCALTPEGEAEFRRYREIVANILGHGGGART